MRFYRNTHDDDGEPRKTDKSQDLAWDQHGLIGHMLSSDGATFDEVCFAVWEYEAQFGEPKTDAASIAYGLIRLCEAGLARCSRDSHKTREGGD